jgi:hypothetical protein
MGLWVSRFFLAVLAQIECFACDAPEANSDDVHFLALIAPDIFVNYKVCILYKWLHLFKLLSLLDLCLENCPFIDLFIFCI